MQILKHLLIYLVTIILFNMMKYPAPDGHIIESKPNPQVVTYSCPCEPSNYSDGSYYSVEACGADTIIGIQAIHINRNVLNGIMNIEIKEFSEDELIEYINNNQIVI